MDEFIENDPELRALADRAEAEGVDLRFFTGNAWLVGENGEYLARGITTTEGTIWVKINDRGWSPTQIYEHETGHDIIAEMGLSKELINAVTDGMTTEEIEAMVADYIADTAGAIKTDDEAMEEIICDARAGKGPRAETKEAVQKILKRGKPTYQSGTDGEVKASFKDGEWRYEISDEGAAYARMGDAQFSKDHPEYARYQELLGKFLSGEIAEDEVSELQEIRQTWEPEAKRLAENVARGNAKLRNIMEHDELYAAYPEIAETRVRFADLASGERGYYHRRDNEIVLDSSLRKNDDELMNTLLHEVQHRIQAEEGFAKGASEEYWESKIEGGRTARDLYLNTAGEIEARETAARRRMTAEERKKTPPRTGGEDVVFAEDAEKGFSIEETDSGERIVVINSGQKAFERLDKSKYAGAAKYIILKRFEGQVLPLGENDLVRITKKSAGEYAYPSKTLDEASDEYKAKMKAAAELDNLLQTSEYSHWLPDRKNHKEATLGFDYYWTKFIIDGKVFEGLVNIANSEKGRVLYDITEIKERPDLRSKYVALLARSSSTFGALDDDNLSRGGKDVNSEESGKVSSYGVELDEEDTENYGEIDSSIRVPGRREKREATQIAVTEGYPSLLNDEGEAVTAIPGWTWVRANDRGNYGVVVGKDGNMLEVFFSNKEQNVGRYVKMLPQELTAVEAQYRCTPRTKDLLIPNGISRSFHLFRNI